MRNPADSESVRFAETNSLTVRGGCAHTRDMSTTATATTATATAKIGAPIAATSDKCEIQASLGVIGNPQDLDVPNDMFTVATYGTGCRYYARFTGRTINKWHDSCPTIELFRVDTVARADGSVWGQVGDRVRGTYLIRSHNVGTVQPFCATFRHRYAAQGN